MSPAATSSQPESVWEFFGRKREGFFVEVGVGHPTDGSRTWLLEQNGWRGLLVEPREKLFELLLRRRPHSQVFRAACCAPGKTGYAELQIPDDTLDRTPAPEGSGDASGSQRPWTEKVELATLDALLAKAGNPKVDFVSIAAAGTELEVLRGFDLKRHEPALVLIEGKALPLAKLRFLRGRGYRLMKRTESDTWYVPQPMEFSMTALGESMRRWRKVFLDLPFRKLRRWRQARRRRAQR